MAEQFTDLGEYNVSEYVLFLLFGLMRLTPAKIAIKTKKNDKEGSIWCKKEEIR